MQLNIKAERERRGWTLSDLEQRSGINKATISRIERGDVRPLLETIEAVATAFGLQVTYKRLKAA